MTSSNAQGNPNTQNLLLASIIFLLFLRLFSEGVDIYWGFQLTRVLTGFLLATLALFFLLSPCVPKGAKYLLTFWLLIICIHFTSQYLSGWTSEGITQLLQLLLFLLFFIFSANPKSIITASLLKNSLSLFLLMTLVFSFYQVLTGGGWYDQGSNIVRAIGFSSHPVLLSLTCFMCALIMFTIDQIQLGYTRLETKLSIACAAGITLLTFSRTTWVIALLFFAILQAQKKNKLRASLYLIAGTIATIFLVIVFAFRFEELAGIYQFIFTLDFMNKDATTRVESSFHWRVIQWYQLFELALEKPIFGYGIGTAQELSAFNKGAHSSLIDTLIETGFLGLTALLVFWLSTAKMLLKHVQNKLLRRVLIAAFLSISVAAILSVSLLDQTLNMSLLFYLLGLSLQKAKHNEPPGHRHI